MHLFATICRRYKGAFLAAAVLAAAFAVLAVQNTVWTRYTPSFAAPELSLVAQSDEDQPVQMAFAGGDNVLSPEMFPMDIVTRPELPSRGITALAGYDMRMFQDVVASSEVVLKSDPDEMVNVELASSGIDGKIVAPYDTFSFNNAVGERSEERGFRSGLMFSGGEVISGVGGGVCIVSTALYDAAVRAGYTVLERYPHSGPVRYAEPGLDAAVVFGCLDMRFKNNTPYPVLIRSRVVDGKLTVTLFGQKQQGLTVELVREGYTELPYKIFEKPDPSIPEGTVEVKSPARAGYETTVLRIIKLNGTVVKKEVLCKDRILPRNKVVLIPVPVSTPVAVEVQPETPEEPASPAEHPSPAVVPPPTSSDSPADAASWQPYGQKQEPMLDVKLNFKKTGAQDK